MCHSVSYCATRSPYNIAMPIFHAADSSLVRPANKMIIRAGNDEKQQRSFMIVSKSTMNSHRQQKGRNQGHILRALSIAAACEDHDAAADDDKNGNNDAFRRGQGAKLNNDNNVDDKMWWVDVLEQYEEKQEQDQKYEREERKLQRRSVSMMKSERSDVTQSTCSISSSNSSEDNQSDNAVSFSSTDDDSSDDEKQQGILKSQEKKKKKEPKQEYRVRFAERVLRRKIPLYSTYTAEEWDRCWYTEEEKMVLAGEREKIVERMDGGKPERINTRNPYRGLEHWTDEGRSYVRCLIDSMINAVMDEQEMQWQTDVDDPQRFALISQMISIDSVTEALHNAYHDEVEAKRIYTNRITTATRNDGNEDNRTPARTGQSSIDDHHQRSRRKNESSGDGSSGRRRHGGNSPSSSPSSRRKQRQGTSSNGGDSPSSSPSGRRKHRGDNNTSSSSSRRLKRNGTTVTKGRNFREMCDPPGPPGSLRSPIPETRKKGSKGEVINKRVSMSGEVICSDWWDLK